MTAADGGDFAPAVMRERIRLLRHHLPFTLAGNLVTSGGVVAVLWDLAPRQTLLPWVLAVWSLSVVRLLLARRFDRAGEHFDIRRWAVVFAVFSGLSGSLWGLAGVALFQHDPVSLLTLVIVLAGMTSGSVVSHSSWLPAYLAFAIPAIVPFALRCILLADNFYFVLGLLSLMFLLVNIYYGRNIQRAQVESIRLRFENLSLIEELRTQKEMAEQASAAKTRFLAAASHDLRQPAQAMELFVDALGHDLAGSPSLRLVERIRAAGRSLGELLDALLDFSRIDAAAIRPAVRDFPVAALLTRVAADLAPQAAGRGLQLRVRPCAAWVRSDPALLERILRNFVSNAVKYTPAGGVLMGCRRSGPDLRIEVHDTGVGIPADQQKHVFREFYQLDNPERDRQKGLGLGLSIADGLARLLHHPLTLRARTGRGSVFAVTVPRGVADDTPPAVPDQESDALRGAAVLVVDDDPAIRDALAELLERWGAVAVVAESADEAVDLLRDARFLPDAILADYRLRGGRTGVEAIQAILAACGRPVPAAILTGDTAPDRLREARASGYPLLHKPVDGRHLRALFAELLASHPLH